MDSTEQETNEPKTVDASMHARGGSPTVRFSPEAIPADDLVTEASSTLKCLRLRNGDYHLYKRVFVVIEGQRHEITMDADAVLKADEPSK